MKTWTLAEARLHWWNRQGFGGGGEVADLVGGWPRCIGGVMPYLAAFARHRATRAQVDAEVAADRLVISPAVRGCIWVVGRDEATLALHIGAEASLRRIERDCGKVGVTAEELGRVQEAVLTTLAAGAMSTSGLRAAMPDGVLRPLGAAGKKVGISSALPPALRMLESSGQVRRRAVGNRLDLERYLWERAPEGWWQVSDAPADPVGRAAWLAERYLRWAAPATLEDFATWAGLGKTVSRKAMAHLGVVETAIEGEEGVWLCLPDQVDVPTPEPTGRPRLLGCLDNLMTLRSLPTLLAPDQRDRTFLTIGKTPRTADAIRWLQVRPIVMDGEWVGLWAWRDPEPEMALRPFRDLPLDVMMALADEAAAVADRIVEDWDGIARTNSIDGERSRARRYAAVRDMTG